MIIFAASFIYRQNNKMSMIKDISTDLELRATPEKARMTWLCIDIKYF